MKKLLLVVVACASARITASTRGYFKGIYFLNSAIGRASYDDDSQGSTVRLLAITAIGTIRLTFMSGRGAGGERIH